LRSFGRGMVVLILACVVVVGATAAERIGPAVPGAAAPGTAVSSVWLCPHGGGDGWDASVVLADPGATPVDVRLTELGTDAPDPSTTLTIPPGHQVIQPVRAGSTSDSTYIEAFGGWVAAGWILSGSDEAPGLGAEPCAPAGGRSWFVVDSDTAQHHHSNLIVMNPYSVDAVFDIALFRPRLPPLRPADWTDVTLAPGRSRSLDVGSKLLGQDVVGVEVDVSRGRVAAAGLSWSADGGIRSVLASPAGSSSWFLPVAQGAGQSTLEIFVPGTDGAQLSTQLLSSEADPIGAGDAAETQQPGASTAGYQIISSGPSSVDVSSTGGQPIVAALRAAGREGDAAATGGAPVPETAWVVTPTVSSPSSRPGVVLVNPGDLPANVGLRLLPKGDTGEGPSTTITVPAHRAAAVPAGFLRQGPAASVLVTSDVAVVALGTSTSGGKRGLDFYASAIGVPIPEGAVP